MAAPFLTNAIVVTLTDDDRSAFHLCVIPEASFNDVAKAFYILSNRPPVEVYGVTSRLAGHVFVIVPDTVATRTLAHEAVHVAVELGVSIQDEETMATTVGHLTADMRASIDEIRRQTMQAMKKIAAEGKRRPRRETR